MIKGLDASSIQGNLPIKDLNDAGIRFLIHKCKQGNDGRDAYFDRNTSAAKNAGWYVGAYHFLYPLPALDPIKQAEGFFAASTLGAAAGELPPALDLEWPDPDAGWSKWGCTAPQVCAWSRKCVERVAEIYGRKPMIYIYPYFAQKLRTGGGDMEWLAEYPLWIASYAAKPAMPEPWKTWAFWQYDGNKGERLPNGVDADFNWFNGDEAALAAFAGKAAPSLDLSSTKGIQLALQKCGFDPGPIDGIPGKRTKAATVAFQSAHGLKPDGIVGPLTRAALLKALS